MAKECGTPKKNGEPCQLRAGWGTAHFGEGRCRKHGGNAGRPPTHGRYSRTKLKELRVLIEQFEQDSDPLNLLPELAACRALFQDYIERYEVWMEAILAWHASFGSEDVSPKPRKVFDLGDARKLLVDISRIVATIERARSENHIARPEFARVTKEMGRVVSRFVTDPEALESIRENWLSIKL